MYKEARKWEDAIRMAEDYMPAKVQEIHMELSASMPGNAGGGGSVESIVARYKLLEKQGQYSQVGRSCPLPRTHQSRAKPPSKAALFAPALMRLVKVLESKRGRFVDLGRWDLGESVRRRAEHWRSDVEDEGGGVP